MADSIEGLEQFMASISTQESGGSYTIVNGDSGARGKYQFMKATYEHAAKLAGVAADWSPESQDAAATALMTDYFNKFGSWEKVATAWYAGPGNVDRASVLDKGQGKYPTIRQYAASVVARMGDVEGEGDATSTGRAVTEADIEAEIYSSYPDLAFLIDDPEIREILFEAADPNRGLDDVTFESRIRQTQWWKTHGESVRTWDARKQMDPATTQREIARAKAGLRRQASALGVDVDDVELEALAERILKFGLSETEVSNQFAEMLNDDQPAGAVRGTLTAMRQLAGRYLVSMSESEVAMWARGVATGQMSEEDFRGRLGEMASAKFAGNEAIGRVVEQGGTPTDFFADHQQLIAAELDMSPGQIDLLDPRFQRVLQHSEGGAIRPMRLDETRELVRSLDEWQNTTTGRKAVASTTKQMLEFFGKVRS